MNSTILMTPKTEGMLRQYMQSERNLCPSLILSGDKGIGKYLIAESVARWFLNLKESVPLGASGDFFAVGGDGRLSFRIQMEELRELAGISPNYAPRRVFLIDNTEQVNQHMLLKILEDQYDNCVFILVAHGDLMPTIYSRCFKIPVDTPSMEMLVGYLSETGQAVDNLLLACSGGKIGFYKKFMHGGHLLNRAGRFLDTLNSMNKKRELLEACNALKEKDPEYLFTVLDCDERIGFLHFLQCIFRTSLSELQNTKADAILKVRCDLGQFYDMTHTLTILEVLERHISMQKRPKGQYSKNDFFDLLILLLE